MATVLSSGLRRFNCSVHVKDGILYVPVASVFEPGEAVSVVTTADLEAFERETLELRKNLTIWCSVIVGDGYCRSAAKHCVSWSDREMAVCDAHLDYARKLAAEEADRPQIDSVWQSKGSLVEWPGVEPRRF